jgi:hypothetical protein
LQTLNKKQAQKLTIATTYKPKSKCCKNVIIPKKKQVHQLLQAQNANDKQENKMLQNFKLYGH